MISITVVTGDKTVTPIRHANPIQKRTDPCRRQSSAFSTMPEYHTENDIAI
jgi:hypothetical protein